MLPFALAVWLTVKRKCWMSFLARHNTFIAGAAGSEKSFLIKQISECTTKMVHVTSTTGRTTKVLKNKAKTIYSFAGIGDCHQPKGVCCVFHVLCGCFFCLFVSEKHPFKYIGACILTSGLFFTSYFRSPQLAETSDKKSEKFHPLSLYFLGQRSGPPRNLRVPDFRNLGSRSRTRRQRSLQQNGGHKTQNTHDDANLIFYSCSKRMWGLPVVIYRTTRHSALTWGAHFSKVPKCFLTQKAIAKFTTPLTTELLYANILDRNRGSLHTYKIPTN